MVLRNRNVEHNMAAFSQLYFASLYVGMEGLAEASTTSNNANLMSNSEL